MKMKPVFFLGAMVALLFQGAFAASDGFDKLALMPVEGEHYLYGYIHDIDWSKRRIVISQFPYDLADAVDIFDAAGAPIDPSALPLNREAAFKLEPSERTGDERRKVVEIHLGKQPPTWLLSPKLRYTPY